MNDPRTFGFIGLGDMGAPMAANLIKGGTPLTVFDKAGTADRAPDGASCGESIADLAAACDVVFLSVPDGPASLSVARDFAEAPVRRTSAVINLSTVGISATPAIAATLSAVGMDYIDAPVSGGRSGAVNATIALMWSGSEALLGELRPVLEKFAKNDFFVGPEPGQGQTLKLVNNFLSAVAMSATSEGIAFGLKKGLDLNTMIDVINVSTGRNTATSDKFPNRIATGTYDAGFRAALMEKDVSLYAREAGDAGAASALADQVATYFRQCIDAYPDGDVTDVFKLIRDLGEKKS